MAVLLTAGDDGFGVGTLFLVLGFVAITAAIAAGIGIWLRRRGR
jgi:hypothetical protein